jgi:hypothetical protein
MTTTNRTYPWSSVTLIFSIGYSRPDGDRITVEAATPTLPLGHICLVDLSLATTL